MEGDSQWTGTSGRDSQCIQTLSKPWIQTLDKANPGQALDQALDDSQWTVSGQSVDSQWMDCQWTSVDRHVGGDSQ